MRISLRSLSSWTITGAIVGFLGVLAVAMLAVYEEVLVDCGPFVREGRALGGRCHSLGYAVSMVTGPLFAFGALAALVGGLAGLATGKIVLRRRTS